MGYLEAPKLVDILSLDKCPGVKAYAQGKQVTFGVGATVTLLSYSGGPGYVSDMWEAIGGAADTAAKEASTLTITVDGVVIYANRFDLFHGSLFSAETWTPAGPVRFDNALTQDRGGLSSFIPIPFSTSILITLTNVGAAGQLWWEIGYHTGVSNTWPRTRKLKTASAYSTTHRNVNDLVTLLDVSGIPRGRMLGLYLMVDSWHGGSPANPATAPLEGAIKIYTDGALCYQSSGTEDYFKMAGYFGSVSGGQNASPYITLQCKDAYHFGGMRFHIPDPITFENALKITWAAGDSSFVNFTSYCLLDYMVWYYTE